jgi:Domain of unknown function (DUF4252)
MKKWILILLIGLPALGFGNHSYEGTPFIKDSDDGTKISLWIPGILVRLGAVFIPEMDFEIKHLVRKIGTVRAKVVDGKYFDDALARQAIREIESVSGKKSLKPLIEIHSPDEHIIIYFRQNKKNEIRKLQIIVLSDDTYVNVRMNCRLKMEDLMEMINSNQ